jgi:hypothetical protein
MYTWMLKIREKVEIASKGQVSGKAEHMKGWSLNEA